MVDYKGYGSYEVCLQVARRGSTLYGMPAPTLVHFEQQIDAELLQGADNATVTPTMAVATDCRGVADGQEEGTQSELAETSNDQRKPTIEVDWMSLDEMVSSSLHFVRVFWQASLRWQNYDVVVNNRNTFRYLIS